MSTVTSIDGEKRNPGTQFDDLYQDVQTAIGDTRTVADLLTSVDSAETNVNAAGYALERMLERAENLHSQMWGFRPGHGKSRK